MSVHSFTYSLRSIRSVVHLDIRNRSDCVLRSHSDVSGGSGSQSVSPAEHLRLLLLLLLKRLAVSDGNDGRIGITALTVSIISGCITR